MAAKSDQRKALSKLGAMRLSRKGALRFLKSKAKVGNYYTLMVQTTSSSGATPLGYIMFEDILNKAYARFLDENVDDPAVKYLSTGPKGDIIESILAMGFIWQNTGS
eukprot:101280-Heterocapsa_arctica.AAC.1